MTIKDDEEGEEEKAEKKKDSSAEVVILKRVSDTVVQLCRPHLPFKQEQYSFEHVFPGDSSQEAVFSRVGLPKVDALLCGADGLVFAYGATGSGKSFTVAGGGRSADDQQQQQQQQAGLVPRTIAALFSVLAGRLNSQCHIVPDNRNHYAIINTRFSGGGGGGGEYGARPVDDEILTCTENAAASSTSSKYPLSAAARERLTTRRYSVFVSFVEIYNNYIYDLLELPEPGVIHWKRSTLKLAHDSKKAVYVQGGSEQEAKSAHQAMQLFQYGLASRQTAATRLNHCSSRSHAVFTLKLVSYEESKCRRRQTALGGRLSVLSDVSQLAVNQLTVVDLAGVERSKSTQATGATLTEAANINKSLLALRGCFQVMRQNQAGRKHAAAPIPYRTDKLTFLLKGFFERGLSQISMIVCVKPSAADLDDTAQVLLFGEKAQGVMFKQPQMKDSEEGEENESQLSEQKMVAAFFNETEVVNDQLNSFSLTRPPAAVDDGGALTTSEDFTVFIEHMKQYLDVHDREASKLSDCSHQLVHQLNEALKNYPERQDHRKSLLLSDYSPQMSSSVAAKLAHNFRRINFSSQFFRPSISATGTPLVSVRTSRRHRRHMSVIRANHRATEELGRELSIWEAANVDMKTKLRGQLAELEAYINQVVPDQWQVAGRRGKLVAGKQCTAKMDVFNRLYQQAPARYRAVNRNVYRLRSAVNTSNVSRLKKLFTGRKASTAATLATADPPPADGKHKLVVSSKINSICKQFSEQQLRHMVASQSEILEKLRA